MLTAETRSAHGRKKMDKLVREEGDLGSSRIPVFVFPSSIVFNASDRDHLKQILTIYNPYEFPVRFKVLSTAPTNYTVIDPEGCISSKNSVDLIVRLTTAVPYESSSSHFEDKFRVQLYDYGTRQPLGRKDVPSIIHFGSLAGSSLINYSQHGGSGGGSADNVGQSEAFQQCPSVGMMMSSGSGKGGDPGVNLAGGSGAGMFYNAGGGGGGSQQHPNYVAVLTAVFCIIGLMLPTNTNDKDSSAASSIPAYLHLTINQKLLIAYTLGLVTMVIFRPQ